MTDTEAHVLSGAYEEKADAYFESPRADYVYFLPANPDARVIELGCGSGATGRLALAEGKAGYYVGIEAFEPMAAKARTVLDRVLVGDVERMALPADLGQFDALIMSEVLEHLTAPEQTLQKLARVLKPDAYVFASSPNISHWSNIRNLLRGRFEYTESGMMDYTHLKWFTPSSFRKMFKDAGFEVTRLEPLVAPRRIIRLLMKIFPGFASLAYFQINLHGRYRPKA